ncbi:MAG: T9SS type A sorting domain-containing protein [Flavobacteriaceae bacterium]|nr:T9SS type A sorting domain-containing protein [Flavobacteriaceae bacterium]
MNRFLLIVSSLFFSFTGFSQSQATYSVTFTSNWSEVTHPHPTGNFPSNAHWSKLVGATHNNQVIFLEMGGLASPGVEDIAELGSNGVFFSEVNDAINAEYANSIIDGDALNTPEGQIVIDEVITTDDFPMLTLLSMIAPSPDWMIAANSIPLLDTNGDWKTQIDINLYPYDAGTDSGTDYASPNMNTDPQEPISSLQGVAPFSNEIMGSFSITLLEVLGVQDNIELQTTLTPNPAQDRVLVSTRGSIQVVEIFNALGAQVASYKGSNSNSEELDIRDLPSGIYLVRVTSEGNSIVKRLVKR